jgi:hypothetical protein
MSRKKPATGDRPPAEPRLILPQVPRSEDLPRSAVTPEGRLIPETPEEREARSKALLEWLADMDDPNSPNEPDPPEMWDEIMRSIDEGRPHRPLFGGRDR